MPTYNQAEFSIYRSTIPYIHDSFTALRACAHPLNLSHVFPLKLVRSGIHSASAVQLLYLPVGSVLSVYEGNDALVKVQRSHVLSKLSPLLTQQTPVLFPQPTICALGRCQPLLNDSPYGHLHMKQPRYAFSIVNRTHIISNYSYNRWRIQD